jgi:hypothetical protein
LVRGRDRAREIFARTNRGSRDKDILHEIINDDPEKKLKNFCPIFFLIKAPTTNPGNGTPHRLSCQQLK